MTLFIKNNFSSIKRFQLFIENIYFILISILTICLPLWKKVIPYIIILIFVTWIFEGNFLKKYRNLKENFSSFLIFISFFLVYIVGLIYTENFDYAFFDLEVKLSFLVFPLIFFSGTYNFIDKKKFSELLIYFIFSCFLSSIISLIISTIQFINTNSTVWFFYVYANYFHHPSYISMYVELSLAAISYLILNNLIQNNKLRILLLSISAWLLIYTILLSSKAGLFGLILILIIVFYQIIIIQKKIINALKLIIGVMLLLLIGYNIIPESNNRLAPAMEVIKKKSNYDVNTEDGTVQRIEIWKTSVEIIKNNILIGVGTGDVKDKLLSEYQKKGMNFAYKMNLNAHGQFFQTTIALGIIGLFVLILILFYPFLLSIRHGNYLYLSFIMLITLNISVESMFENQAGVVFYAFFNSFLFINSKLNYSNTNIND